MDGRTVWLSKGNHDNPRMVRVQKGNRMVEVAVRCEKRGAKALCGGKHGLVVGSELANIVETDGFMSA